MNTFSVLCLSFILVQLTFKTGFALDESDYWGRDKEDCVKELNLNRERIIALDRQEIVTEYDPQFNRFAQCFFLKSGIQDLNGAIKYDKIREIFEEKIDQNYVYFELEPEKLLLLKKVALNAVTWCENNLSQHVDTPGQLAVRVGNCIMQYMKSVSK